MVRILKYVFCLVSLLVLSMPFSNSVAGTVDGATYSIISEDDFRDDRRTVQVRLDKKVSAETIKIIAQSIKKTEHSKFKRTFIIYYLPDMKVGSGGWATSHFEPDLKVSILGLSAKEENAMTQAAETASAGRDVVGVWLDEDAYAGVTITVYRENKKLYVESKYKDGSESTAEMTENKLSNGTRLVEKGGNPHGEYLVLGNNGDLQAGGKNGIFLKYKKLQ